MERYILDSGVIFIPVGVRDRIKPDLIHEFNLSYDLSDRGIKEAMERNEITKIKLNKMSDKYAKKLGDEKLTDENLPTAIEGMSDMLRTQFDSDFGQGSYDEIANAGGGNSFINMLDLYFWVSDYLEEILNKKMEKINKKSQNRKAKYLKKRNK